MRLLARFPQEPLHEWNNRLKAGTKQIEQFIQSYHPPPSSTESSLRTSTSITDPPKARSRGNQSFLRWIMLLCIVSSVLIGAIWFYSASRVPSLHGRWISKPTRDDDFFFVYVLDIQQEGTNLDGSLRTHSCNPYAGHTTAQLSFQGSIAKKNSSTRLINLLFDKREKINILPYRISGIFEFDTKLSPHGFFSTTQFVFTPDLPSFASQTNGEWNTLIERVDTRLPIHWCNQK